MALIKCSSCGKEISSFSDKCVHCGKPVIKYRVCSECKNEYESTLLICPNCGKKENLSSLSSNDVKIVAKSKLKDFINFKKNTKTKILILISLLLVIAGFIFLPDIIKPYTSYIEDGDFEQAYQHAKDDEKRNVLFENLLTYLSADVEDGQKKPDSFVLKNAYYYDEKFVLEVNGINSYDKLVTNYWYYKFDDEKNEYSLYVVLSDFNEQTYNAYSNSYSEIYEILLRNEAKKTVKEIISDESNLMNEDYVKRINKKHESGILKDTKLISQVNSIYPKSSNTI